MSLDSLSDPATVAPRRRREPHPKTLPALVHARLRLERTGLVNDPTVASLGRSLRRLESRLARPARITLLGEFNAGKSSLANLLIGRPMLPTDILSSTRAPTLIRPAGGQGQARVSSIGLDGRRQKYTMDDVERLSRERAQILEVGLPNNDRLREFEILDTPGISDPTNEHAFADAVSVPANIALWCTLATQAWRESERWAWESLPRRLQAASLMVVTHKDALLGPDDGRKVVDRMRHEAGGLFKDIVLVSIVQAARARNYEGEVIDPDLWRSSGGEELMEKLSDLVARVSDRRLVSAEMVVRCLAKRSRRDAETRKLPDDRPQILSAWMDVIVAVSSKIDPEKGDGATLARNIVEEAGKFVSETLEPWLRLRLETEEADRILALAPIDYDALFGVVEGLAPNAAAKFLKQVVEQAQVELPQALMSVDVKPRLRPIAPELGAFLDDLSVFPPKDVPDDVPQASLDDPNDED